MDLNKKFNLPEPVPNKGTQLANLNVEDDFDYSRNNIITNIEIGQEALQEMFDIAKASQHPSAFRVLNEMLRNVTDLSKNLLEVQQQKKELEKSPGQGPQTVNNNLVLSTADLAKMLENLKK